MRKKRGQVAGRGTAEGEARSVASLLRPKSPFSLPLPFTWVGTEPREVKKHGQDPISSEQNTNTQNLNLEFKTVLSSLLFLTGPVQLVLTFGGNWPWVCSPSFFLRDCREKPEPTSARLTHVEPLLGTWGCHWTQKHEY